MKGNFLRCRCEVFVEGQSIGEFASFNYSNTREEIGAIATLSIPLYTIAVDQKGTPPGEEVPLTSRVRIGIDKSKIVPGALIAVYAWYDSADIKVSFEPELVFYGFITDVHGAFPTEIKCQDLSYILRFSKVTRAWGKITSLREVMNAVIPAANAAFTEYRKEQGLTGDFPTITVEPSATADTQVAFEPWKDISPYNALQKICTDYNLYGNTLNDGRLYIGNGNIGEESRQTVQLNTRLNVIGCDIVPKNNLFDNYYVQVTAKNVDGKKMVASYGNQGIGNPFRLKQSPINTQDGIDNLAKRVYDRLVSGKNSGTIITKLYPVAHLFDFVKFDHTLFPELSGDYYVIGKELELGSHGFNQSLSITDEKYAF